MHNEILKYLKTIAKSNTHTYTPSWVIFYIGQPQSALSDHGHFLKVKLKKNFKTIAMVTYSLTKDYNRTFLSNLMN